MAEYEIAPKSLTIINPGQLVSCGQMDINGDTLFISIDFLKDINIDLNAVTSPPLLKNHISPVMPLSDNEFDLIARYFELLHSNAETIPHNCTRGISGVRSLRPPYTRYSSL